MAEVFRIAWLVTAVLWFAVFLLFPHFFGGRAHGWLAGGFFVIGVIAGYISIPLAVGALICCGVVWLIIEVVV